ncbi:hypothetical protein DPMN_153405 [Dreissena polymorpha]|uniref:Uncharacterized protein n=1 Tax=Dreissena polymorpha TaxID=45954 RepID=A0A9D4J893_DREPO|nr:hypothetical protein DPMN_153405 [Dreissena polymorpha]
MRTASGSSCHKTGSPGPQPHGLRGPCLYLASRCGSRGWMWSVKGTMCTCMTVSQHS